MVLYGLLIRFYYVAVWCASFFSVKAGKWIEGRKKVKEQFAAVPFSEHKWVWFHCSSFGEFQDGRTLLEAFRLQYPGTKIILTFFSPTGYELQKNIALADYVCYLPLDTKANATHFLNTVKPVAAFIVRNDIWPNYIAACTGAKIPCFLISFTLNLKSKFIQFPLRSFYRKAFRQFSGVFVHDNLTKQILLQAGFSNNILVSGNSRIDRALEICNTEFNDGQIEKFIANNFCIIAGSTHTKDRELFLESFIQNTHLPIKWIIVPHEIDRKEIEDAKKLLGKQIVVYSECSSETTNAKLLWIDQVGMLSKMYRYADISFIGGGFNSAGIHSILEPAVYGCPVCFGPNYRYYVEAIEMLRLETAFVVRNPKELSDFIDRYKNNFQVLEDKHKQNKDLMSAQAGATNKIMAYVHSRQYFK